MFTWLLEVCLLDFLVQISQAFQLKPIRTGLTQTVTSDPSFAFGTRHLQNLAPTKFNSYSQRERVMSVSKLELVACFGEY